MHSAIPLQPATWLEFALVLGVGSTIIIALGMLTGRLPIRASWRRAVWQTVTLALCVLLLAEVSGTTAGLLAVFTSRISATQHDRPAKAVVVAGTEPQRTPSAIQRSSHDPLVHERREKPQLLPWTSFGEIPREWKDEAVMAGTVDPSRSRRGLAAEDLPDPAVALAERRDADRSELLPEQSNGRVRAAGASEAGAGGPVWPAALWVAGWLALSLRTVGSRWLLLRFARRQKPVADPALIERVRQLALQLGVRRDIRLLAAPGLTSPAAFGYWRPAIALPEGFAVDFGPRQRDAMLVHELAHLSAADPAWHLAADLLVAAMWWHPLLWAYRSAMRSASESAADEATILLPDGPDTLADCLLRLGRRMSRMRRLAWLPAAGSGFRSGLGRRVERLLQLAQIPQRPVAWQPPAPARLWAARATLPWCLLILAVTCTAWARTQATHAKGRTTMTTLKTSWGRSLAASALFVLLAPLSGDLPEGVLAQQEDAVQERERESDMRPRLDEERQEHQRPRREAAQRREGERREREAAARRREREGQAGQRERAQPRDEEVRRLIEIRQQLQKKAQDIQAELGELGGRIVNDRTRELNALRERLMTEIREVEARIRGRAAPRREGERPRPMGTRLEELQREIAEAVEAGRRELAERLRREAHELAQRLEGRRQPPRDREPAPELQRRLEHLHIAIDNLKAAGLHEQAEQLMHQAERFEAELHRAHTDRDRQHSEHELARHVDRVVHQLHEEMEEIRHQVDELRGAVRMLIQRHEREERHDEDDEDDEDEEEDEDDDDDDEEEDD